MQKVVDGSVRPRLTLNLTLRESSGLARLLSRTSLEFFGERRRRTIARDRGEVHTRQQMFVALRHVRAENEKNKEEKSKRCISRRARGGATAAPIHDGLRR